MNRHFCTCTDLKCACHPANQPKGCDPCVRKNLRQGEIPSCFYRLVSEDVSGLGEYTVEAFVRFYLEQKGDPRERPRKAPH